MTSQERQKILLNRIVEEYIGSAQPVSSKLIENKYRLGVCPATIRNDMAALTEEGFLTQPHTSAGRVPTDKGYRFFVDGLLEKGFSHSRKPRAVEEMLSEEAEELWRMMSHLSRFMAAASSNLATVHLLERDFFWKEGWEEVLKEPEFEEKDFREEFTDLVKECEGDMKNLETADTIEIYIGRENPFKRTKNFSIITARCFFPEQGEGRISLIGPKRMPYRKNIGLVESILKALDDF